MLIKTNLIPVPKKKKNQVGYFITILQMRN